MFNMLSDTRTRKNMLSDYFEGPSHRITKLENIVFTCIVTFLVCFVYWLTDQSSLPMSILFVLFLAFGEILYARRNDDVELLNKFEPNFLFVNGSIVTVCLGYLYYTTAFYKFAMVMISVSSLAFGAMVYAKRSEISVSKKAN